MVNVNLSNYDDLSQVDICFEADGFWWSPCVIDAITISATPVGIADCTGYTHNVDDNPITTQLYHAKTTVTSSGTVHDNSTVDFKAGNAINLESDFTVDEGGLFEASIEDCNDLSSLVHIVPEEFHIESANKHSGKHKFLLLQPAINFENIQLVNLKGEILFNKTRSQWNAEIKNAQGLPINLSKGVYYLKVLSMQKELIRRVVLE